MIKFNEIFREYFKNLHFVKSEYSDTVNKYVQNTDIIAKETLWGLLSTIEYITEVNYIISLWRREVDNSKLIEIQIESMVESSKGHSVIGKVLKFTNIANKYTQLIQEERKSNLQYNGFKILPQSTFFLQLFY